MRMLPRLLLGLIGTLVMALALNALHLDWSALFHGDFQTLSVAAGESNLSRAFTLLFLMAVLPALFLPITALMLASATLLPGPAAVLVILGGTLLNAALCHGAGRLFGVKLWSLLGLEDKAFIKMLKEGAAEHGFKMVLVSRFMPVPFCVPSIASALVGIGFWTMMLGTAITMLPWALFYVFFTESLRSGSGKMLGPALAVFATLSVVAWWVRRYYARRSSPALLEVRTPPMGPELTLYTLPGHEASLEARRVLGELRSRLGFEVREVDISGSPDLEAQYHDHVPVVYLGDLKLFSFQVDENALERYLKRAGAP